MISSYIRREDAIKLIKEIADIDKENFTVESAIYAIWTCDDAVDVPHHRLIDAVELVIDYGFTYSDIPPTEEELYELIGRQRTIIPAEPNE